MAALPERSQGKRESISLTTLKTKFSDQDLRTKELICPKGTEGRDEGQSRVKMEKGKGTMERGEQEQGRGGKGYLS